MSEQDAEGRTVAKEDTIYHFRLGKNPEQYADVRLRRNFHDGRLEINIVGGCALDLSPQAYNAFDVRTRRA